MHHQIDLQRFLQISKGEIIVRTAYGECPSSHHLLFSVLMDLTIRSVMICKAKMQYLLTCNVSRYWFLVLNGSMCLEMYCVIIKHKLDERTGLQATAHTGYCTYRPLHIQAKLDQENILGETQMTLLYGHRIRNASPGGLKLSTLPPGHGNTKQIYRVAPHYRVNHSIY